MRLFSTHLGLSGRGPRSICRTLLYCLSPLAVLILSPTFAVAQGGPGPANQRSIEEYSEAIKNTYITPKAQQIEQRKAEVEQLINQVAAAPQSRWDNWQGATSGEVQDTINKDIEDITGASFSKCQPNNMRHSYPQMLTPPYKVHQNLGGLCITYHKYVGVSSGIAWHCQTNWACVPAWPISCHCCTCRCNVYDVVDYYYPTYKLDSSEQILQTKYLDKNLAAGMLEANHSAIQGSAALARQDMQAMRGMVLGNMASRGITGLQMGASPQQADIQAFFNSRNDVKSNAEQSDILLTSPDQTNIYTRNLFEILNLMSESFWWLPHHSKIHWFGTDMPGGFEFSKHLSMGAILGNKYQRMFQDGAGACVGHDIATGKSPTGMGPYQSQTNDALCLTKIGERFPLVESGRMNITDRTYRGIAKDLDLFFILLQTGSSLVPEGHSYKEAVDKLLVLRNDALKQEQPNCAALPKIVKNNVEYERSNIKELKKGGNNTHEMFTAFRGAWGLKGKQSSFFERCGGDCKSWGFCPAPCPPHVCPNGILRFSPADNGGNADTLPWPNHNCFRTE